MEYGCGGFDLLGGEGEEGRGRGVVVGSEVWGVDWSNKDESV